MLFTSGSIFLIGLISKYFNRSILIRIFGVLLGSLIFFIISNLGVWLGGSYGYSFSGLVSCYILALPFFSYTIISSLVFSVIIETIYKVYQKNTINI